MFLMAVNQASNNDKLVTDMQDKLTEIQQHEIEFLNNFITHLGWIFGGVVSVVGIIVIYIGYANRQAEKKMKEAEKILGEAETVRLELIQDKADLAAYREETRKEFSELISLVNSEEIAHLKNNITILSITGQIRNKYEEGRRLMDAYWEDYRRLQRNHKFDLTEGYRECTASAIAIASKLKEPLADLTEANELLDETVKWKKRVEKTIREVSFEAEPFFIDEYMKDFGEKVKLQEKIDSLQEKIDSLAE